MKIQGMLVDIHLRDIYPAILDVSGGIINSITRTESAPSVYILPGLIDSHIHIESSMITPGAFAVAAVRHGTTSVVSDPHEIANVLGIDGVKFMIEDGRKVPLKFNFGAPSCVPATEFERSGASLHSKEIEALLELDEIKYLSEMMNFPGVIYGDPEVKEKLEIAKRMGKPVDGHAPGLTGDNLKKYISAGISTDHECSSMDEAMEKISLGMKVLIREGSAARNLNSLKDLFNRRPEMIMLCSDDLHPEMLRERHINKIIAKLILSGYNAYDVIRSATINPVLHYKIKGGLLREGDPADIVIVDSLETMNVLETWIDGVLVFSSGEVQFSYNSGKAVNKFNCSEPRVEDICIKNNGGMIRVIEAFEGELLTKEIRIKPDVSDFIGSNVSDDILKIVVKDRYNDGIPSVGFIKGFGLKRGAFASSIAHDSHNIIAVGTNDEDIVSAINQIVSVKGGLAVSCGGKTDSLTLNIGGIMTTRSCDEVADDYERLNKLAGEYGCTMKAPFMTLSFMALLVIPELKIGDRGLFDGKKFELVDLFV
ncbi:MAG: adenine deaminase [Bacteroidales bacterium]|nr:adenine deaminase [Bacteroidales bacterium]